jgi:hypothetical protein
VRIVGLEGVDADRAVDAGLALAVADLGLEPLPMRIDEADQRDRNGADQGGDPREVVIGRVRLGIEDPQRAKLREPLGLVPALSFGRTRLARDRNRQLPNSRARDRRLAPPRLGSGTDEAPVSFEAGRERPFVGAFAARTPTRDGSGPRESPQAAFAASSVG